MLTSNLKTFNHKCVLLGRSFVHNPGMSSAEQILHCIFPQVILDGPHVLMWVIVTQYTGRIHPRVVDNLFKTLQSSIKTHPPISGGSTAMTGSKPAVTLRCRGSNLRAICFVSFGKLCPAKHWEPTLGDYYLLLECIKRIPCLSSARLHLHLVPEGGGMLCPFPQETLECGFWIFAWSPAAKGNVCLKYLLFQGVEHQNHW